MPKEVFCLEFKEGKIMRVVIVQNLTRILLFLGGTALLAMMFLTALDVVMRYIFHQSISSASELIKYLMTCCVAFGVVYCEDQKAHVTVDLVMINFSKKVQAVFKIITNAIAMFLVFLLAWQNILHTKRIYDSGVASPVLYIPAYPFVGIVAFGFFVFFLILVIHVIEACREVNK